MILVKGVEIITNKEKKYNTNKQKTKKKTTNGINPRTIKMEKHEELLIISIFNYNYEFKVKK